MPELRICEDASAWDGFVSQAKDASVLQAWAWGSLKSRYGWQVRRFFWVDQGKPVGAAAVLRRGLPGGLAPHYAPALDLAAAGPNPGGQPRPWAGFWAALAQSLSQDRGHGPKVRPEWTTDAQR